MRFIIALSIIICTYQAKAQVTVESWQTDHPEILFFESEQFYSLSEEQQAQLADKVILYTKKITLSDIQQFEASSAAVTKAAIPIDEHNGDEIKIWLGEHPYVKIITQDYFNSLTSSKQYIYIQNGTLILSGNTITLNDLTNYEVSY